MLRRSLIAILGVLLLAGTAPAASTELMPGVTYERLVEFTTHGPVAVHVLTAPRPAGLWGLEPALSNETILGSETVTAIQERYSAGATVAGVNGDLFNAGSGRPSGMLMRNGALDHAPLPGRSSLGIDSAGNLRVSRVALLATWQGAGPRRALNALNGLPGPNGVALFTTAWGPATPALPGAVEVVLAPFPPATPNVELTAAVVQVAGNGGTAIPAGGAVLAARGTAAARLEAEAPVGQTARIRLILKPDWTGVVDAIGGGPVLVRNGGAVFRSNEQFTPDQLIPRHPRSAVAQLADGRVLLVAADGRQPGYSVGITNFELALLLVRLGAVTATALDGGGSTTMAFEGQLLNRPSGAGGERPVAESLLVTYGGIYVPPPLEPVLSPNGDGVAEQQKLAYKVVRPSSVTANLVGPDGVARQTFAGSVAPGSYPLAWTGLKPDGSPEAEGRWHWVVTAVDDQGQTSSGDRGFWLNTTLGFGATVPPALAVPRASPRPVATFRLTRAAIVTTRIETASGTILKTLQRRRLEPGDLEVTWDGRTGLGGVVYSGRYLARVIAENELGPVELAAPFTVRRLVGPPKTPKKPVRTRR